MWLLVVDTTVYTLLHSYKMELMVIISHLAFLLSIRKFSRFSLLDDWILDIFYVKLTWKMFFFIIIPPLRRRDDYTGLSFVFSSVCLLVAHLCCIFFQPLIITDAWNFTTLFVPHSTGSRVRDAVLDFRTLVSILIVIKSTSYSPCLNLCPILSCCLETLTFG